MTIEEVQDRMRSAHSAFGYGRFALTLSMDGREEAYITHWFKPTPHSFEDCRAVGSGTVSECLDAMDRYASRHATIPAIAAE